MNTAQYLAECTAELAAAEAVGGRRLAAAWENYNLAERWAMRYPDLDVELADRLDWGFGGLQ